jgi:hypothetical protein
MTIDDVNKPDDDRCYYCGAKGEFWDQAGATIITVCKKHHNNYYIA